MGACISRVLTAALALLLAAPASALACPVCGLAGSEESGAAYLGMTVMLSALPLGMIAGVAIWVRRRIVAADAAPDHSRSSTHAEPSPTMGHAPIVSHAAAEVALDHLGDRGRAPSFRVPHQVGVVAMARPRARPESGKLAKGRR